MRPVKFRFWDYFREGDPIRMEYDIKIYEESGNSILDILDKPDDYKLKVMQFTGEYDQNKKEIFEGDIIQINKNSIFEVIYENARFWAKPKIGSYYDFSLCLDIVEVVGNIYETPELIA